MLSKTDIMKENTLKLKLNMWTLNLRNNLYTITQSQDITDLPDINNSVLCIGAGKSTELHYEEIKKFKGTIISCEKNLIDLIKHDIIPDYFVCIDGNKYYANFLNYDILKLCSKNITGIFSTVVSPEVLCSWNGKKVFFNAWIDNTNEIKSISSIFQTLTNKTTLQTGGNCGSAMWFIANQLKAKKIILLGIDMAYPASIPDLSHTGIWQFVSHLPREEILLYYRREKNPFGYEVITDFAWQGMMESFITWIKDEQNSVTYQCSDYTILHEYPLITKSFKEVITEI